MLAALGAVVAAIAAAFFQGNKSGRATAQADAATTHQKAEEKGREATVDAQRTDIGDRLRNGKF